MIGAVEQLAAQLGSERRRALLAFHQRADRLPLLLDQLVGGKNRVQRGIGEQIEESWQVLNQPFGADRGGVQSAARLDRRANEVRLLSELRGGFGSSCRD